MLDFKGLKELLLNNTPDSGSVWRHYKGGCYRVVTCVLRESDLTVMVVYSPVNDPGVRWCRPLAEWEEYVAFGVHATNTVGIRRYKKVRSEDD